MQKPHLIGRSDKHRELGKTVSKTLRAQTHTSIFAQPRLWLGLIAVGLGQAASGVALTLGVAFSFELATQQPAEKTSLFLMGLGFVLLAGGMFVLRVLERSLSEHLGQSHVHGLRLQMWDHLVSMPASTIRNDRRGAIVLRFVGDLSSIKSWVARGLCGGFVALLSLLGAISALVWLDWRLAALVLLILFALTLFQVARNRTLRDSVKATRKARGRLATDIVERVDALLVIQAFNQHQRERRRLEVRSLELGKQARRVARAAGSMTGASDAAAVALVLATFVTASTLGIRSPGTLAASLVLTRFLAGPIRRLVRMQELYQRSEIAHQKIERFLALPCMSDAAHRRPPKEGLGHVKLRGLKVAGVLNQASATIAGGQIVRLIGDNGAGKSTLLRLIAGLDQPTAGKIIIDGRNLERASLFDARAVSGVVSEDLPLLRGSVRRNLLYGWPKAPAGELDRITSQTQLESLLSELPGGLDFRLSDGGKNLSAGQRQRLQIARALVGSPRLLLLDEANRHLDDKGLEMLHQTIKQHEGTVIFVWHGSDAPQCDTTWLLRGGELHDPSERKDAVA